MLRDSGSHKAKSSQSGTAEVETYRAGLLGRELLLPGLELVIGNILLELNPSISTHSSRSSRLSDGVYEKCLPPTGGSSRRPGQGRPFCARLKLSGVKRWLHTSCRSANRHLAQRMVHKQREKDG